MVRWHKTGSWKRSSLLGYSQYKTYKNWEQSYFRPPQTTDFLDSLRGCPPVRIFTVAGNLDIGNFAARKMSWTGYVKQFMAPSYYFQFGERYYIFLDTQCYKLDFDYGGHSMAWKLRKKQDEWFESLCKTLPRNASKTVVMHTALFLELSEEQNAKKKLKSLPLDVSTWLTKLFSYNNVDTVFSGHVHFENFSEPVNNVRQVILTSIMHWIRVTRMIQIWTIGLSLATMNAGTTWFK